MYDIIGFAITFGGILIAALVAYVVHLRYHRELDRQREAEARASGRLTPG
jgi:hypothetical protein